VFPHPPLQTRRAPLNATGSPLTAWLALLGKFALKAKQQ
jgi:hypothetical protein